MLCFCLIRPCGFFSLMPIDSIMTAAAAYAAYDALNSSKAHGWDGISAHMIKLCDSALLEPLCLIFERCLETGIYLSFLVYINEIVENVNCDIKMFADDTPLFSLVRDEGRTAFELNCDRETFRLWAWKWKMQFNSEKTEEVIFCQAG